MVHLKEREFFTSIGERWSLSILLALKDADRPIILKELSSVTGNPQSLRLRLDRMEEEGLIDMVIVLSPHKYVTISLTDNGKEVVSLLSQVDSMVAPERITREKSIDMRYADPILRMLLDREYIVQKEILEIIKSYSSVTKVLQALEDDGLVFHSLKEEWPKENRYSLTPLGRKVAEIYQSVFRIIDSVRFKE